VHTACPSLLDVIAPFFAGANVKNKTWRINPRGAIARRRKSVPLGTAFRFTLSEPAGVTFTIERKLRGRKVKKRCRPKTRKNRKAKKCTRYGKTTSFVRQASAGQNSVAFSGRYRKKGRVRSLKPGRYRATLTARDAAGNVSAGRRLSFRVVR
jgi:hypothetical protein